MSAWALREGIVLEVIGRADPALWTSDAHAIRRSSVLGLARRCNWDEAHSRHVTRLALDLFDATIDLHGFGADERELLDHAALLHDIGTHVAHESHHKHTAYLIQHGKLRGYDPEQVDALACLARYHRRGEPKASHEPFNTLDARGPGPGHQAGRPPPHRRRPRPQPHRHGHRHRGRCRQVTGAGRPCPAPATCRWSCGAPAASASCSRRSSAGGWSSPSPRPGARPADRRRRRRTTAVVTTTPAVAAMATRGVGRHRAGQGPTGTGHRPAADVEQRHLHQRPRHGRRRHPPVGQAAGPGQHQDLAGGRQADEHQAQPVPEGGQRRPPAAGPVEDRRRPLPVEPAEEEVGRVGRAQAEERDRRRRRRRTPGPRPRPGRGCGGRAPPGGAGGRRAGRARARCPPPMPP